MFDPDQNSPDGLSDEDEATYAQAAFWSQFHMTVIDGRQKDLKAGVTEWRAREIIAELDFSREAIKVMHSIMWDLRRKAQANRGVIINDDKPGLN